MRACRRIAGLSLVLLATFVVAQKSDFEWNWRNQEVIGREDASVGTTSKLTEPERSAMLDAIVLRLQKPMSDAGYDDDRIREIASTTRVRFIDAGAGEPLIFATSLGLEGGCDALGNCPLWVFRRTSDGFLSLLNTIAASYTTKLSESSFEVVFMHHVSAKQSGLTAYHLVDGALQGTGCYIAEWPKPSDDPTQVSDPKIEPCKGQPALFQTTPPENQPLPLPALQAPSEPASQPPAADQPEAQPKPDTAAPKEQAPAPEAPKADQAQPASPAAQPDTPKADQPQTAPDQPTPQATPDSKSETPKADQPQAEPQAPSSDSQPGSPRTDQQPPQQPAPDAKAEAPKSDEPPAPSQPPEASSRQDAPKSDDAQPAQSQPEQPAPDSKPESPKPDQPPPSSDPK